MERTTLSLLMLCFVLVAKAEPIGKQAALYTAQSYMLAKGKTVTPIPASLSLPRVGATARKTSPQQAWDSLFYIFNAGNDGGYVIVSGDDRTEPILGYVDHGTFDPADIPENMRSWLQLYADQIKFIVDNDIKAESPMLRKSKKVRATKHSIPELLTTRWNQGSPYNILCPLYYKGDGTQARPASGCVATAMAQVVNFYKFPLKTKAVIAAHSKTYTLDDGTQKTITAKAIPRNTPIDWENMRDSYSWNGDENATVQDTAVAQLMLMCGQGVKMGWGASSGASTSNSRDFFVNCFGYNERAYWGGRGNYSIDEWFDMLYNEISAGYPVLYAGHSSGGGHAFVLDGFDGDNLFHVNWGWGGSSNGWFLVSILNPGDNSGMGASSSSDGYSMSQGALFGLRAPSNPKEDTYLSIRDVTIVNTSIKATFANNTGATGGFHAAILMENEDGELSLVGVRQTISTLAQGSTVTKTFPLKGKLSEGTYRLSPACKPSKSEAWRTKYDMQSQYIEAVVDSLGTLDLHFMKPIPTTEDISIDTITFPGTRIVGKQQEVKVTFRNNGAEYFRTIYLFAGKEQTKTYTESKSMVAIRSGETLDVSYFFKPDETGTYNLWFCTDDKGNNVMGQGTMEVIAEADAAKANLAVTSFTIANGSGEVAYGKRLVGKATIRNNAKTDYHGGIKMQLWSQKIGNSTAWSGSTHTYNVDILAGRVGNVDFEFNNLNEGYYYRLKVMYTNQDGTLTSGGIWDHKWEAKEGILTWKNDGTIAGQAYRTTITTSTTVCGVLADCNKITRMTPNKTNPNTIYAFAQDMQVPASLDTCNAVSGGHAGRINLVGDKPYFVPVSFKADSASFTYTFPETEDGTGWHTFTMPFAADSAFVDSIPVSLNDSLSHFWIYEYAAQGNNGRIIFSPVTELRAGTPYIIAADATMAGRSVVFRSVDVPFFKTGSDKMLVTTPDYKFHGNTLAPKVKDCYVLNADGTAFEYVTTTTALASLASYFTTTLPEDVRQPLITLPKVPKASTKAGDLNGDSYIDIADAVCILEIMASGTSDTKADINRDGNVDIADFVCILEMMAGQ